MRLTKKEDMMYTWDFVKTWEKMGYQKGYRAGKKCTKKSKEEQIEELASYLLEYFPHELRGEGAVELTIRLLGELHGRRGATEENRGKI